VDPALDLLASLETKLASLHNGSEETRRIAHEMQVVVDEMRRVLKMRSEGDHSR
jgi:hypothetical protein